jgi:hypothetical protein
MGKFKKKPAIPLKDQGFIFRDVGSKTNYGVFHKDRDEGKTLVCWMSKPNVKSEDLEPGKFKIALDENLKYRIKENAD